MAGYLVSDTRKVTTHRLMEMKERGEKISMLTSYDYTTARIVDEAGVDAILVGDSASNVMAGNVTTLPITVDQMIYHARSVVRGVKRALVVVDMPFGSYQADPFDGVRNAMRMMKETGADALKLEGGEEVIEAIRKIIGAGVPVMGHLGLMPQSINKYGTYGVRAKGDAEADKLLRDAPVCRPECGDDRCHRTICDGCEVGRFPERVGTILNNGPLTIALRRCERIVNCHLSIIIKVYAVE